jgi:hypothetical protein
VWPWKLRLFRIRHPQFRQVHLDHPLEPLFYPLPNSTPDYGLPSCARSVQGAHVDIAFGLESRPCPAPCLFSPLAEQVPTLVDATTTTVMYSQVLHSQLVLIGHYFFSPLWVHIKEASVTSARDTSLALKSANPTCKLICVT